jgi:hypothetical protein
MVASELLDELNRIRGNFTWHYDGESKRIRAKLRFRSQALLFDPIGAVCYTKTGVVFGEDHWLAAAEKLGLSHIDAADLTAAANNVSQLSNRIYVDRLRSRIIEDVRLRPEIWRRGFRMPDTFLGFVSLLIFGRHVNSSLTSSR